MRVKLCGCIFRRNVGKEKDRCGFVGLNGTDRVVDLYRRVIKNTRVASPSRCAKRVGNVSFYDVYEYFDGLARLFSFTRQREGTKTDALQRVGLAVLIPPAALRPPSALAV